MRTARALPVQAIQGPVVWGRDGSVWACHWVEPFGYPHRSIRDAHDIHARTVAALLTLPRHSLILSVTHHLAARELEARIRGEVDPSAAPEWAAQARHAAASAADPIYERRWILAVRIPGAGGATRVLDRLRAARSEVETGFGAPHSPPTGSRTKAALAQADMIEDQLAQHVTLRRLDASEVRWLYERAPLRGLTDPTPLHKAGQDGSPVAVARLDRDAVYVEGGRPGVPDRPRHWRYLTVEHPDAGTAHQAFACLGETPPTWTFPYGSGEWLWHLDDQVPFPLDWAVRLERVDNQPARRRALRAKRNLVGQLEEPGGDPAGPPTTLAAAVVAIDDHRARLEANPELPAFRATTIVALADRDLGVLERHAATFESTFRAAGFNFYRPTGAQLACFTAMLPGASPSSVISEYSQDLLPDGLASAMPFAGSGVGDPGGMLLGYSLDTLSRRPVFLDPARGPRDLDRSGSLAAIGELGSGKSFFAKILAANTVAMGGQVVVVDRTDHGEYRRLGDVVAGTSQLVEVSEEASVSLDPFQVFDSDEHRLRYGVGFITLLTGTPPASTAAAHCHRAAQQALDTASADRPARLSDVIPILVEQGGAAADVADKLNALSSISYGRLVFGDTGPPVSLDADFVCFHLRGLRLPRRGSPREEILPEELLGQAMMYLVAAFSRRVLFGDPNRFAALLLDEAHALTANPQGRALVGDLIRDGRKHFAAVWAFSQLPSDFAGDDNTLDALLGYRVVFRQSHQTAPDALAFLGSDDRDDNIETVTGLGTGQCLLRDPTGRLGLVDIASPQDPDMLAALSTTPAQTAMAAGPWPSLNGSHRVHDLTIPQEGTGR
ncbi:MAG: ATP-binding protein [Acidobacteria bacterium]|nr:ATP-binding protein [Acidobacteriota bacterium]